MYRAEGASVHCKREWKCLYMRAGECHQLGAPSCDIAYPVRIYEAANKRERHR